MIYSRTINTPAGRITISCDGEFITEIKFGGNEDGYHPLLDIASAQLNEYFNGTRRKFNLPINPAGTEFQKRVWSTLLKIPYGETRSYGQIAAAIGNPKGARAVGAANNKNPIAIVIPCHRVIGADGALTGYAGGLDIKAILLETEKRFQAEGGK